MALKFYHHCFKCMFNIQWSLSASDVVVYLSNLLFDFLYTNNVPLSEYYHKVWCGKNFSGVASNGENV